MLRDVANRIKKKKRWLIDKKPKKTVTTTTSSFWGGLWFICFLITLLGLILSSLQLNNMRTERNKFQNLYLTKPTKTVIIRPRLVNKVQKEIIEKKVYVRIPVKQKPRSGWKHLPERRGAYIR